MPNIRDLSDPEFGPIKARLARAYLEHKGDLGVLLTDDAEIIAHVDEITALLLAAWSRRRSPTTSAGRSAIAGFPRLSRSYRAPYRASRSMAERGGARGVAQRHEWRRAACARLFDGGDAAGGWRASVSPARRTTSTGGSEIGSCLVSQMIAVVMLLPPRSTLAIWRSLSSSRITTSSLSMRLMTLRFFSLPMERLTVSTVRPR